MLYIVCVGWLVSNIITLCGHRTNNINICWPLVRREKAKGFSEIVFPFVVHFMLPICSNGADRSFDVPSKDHLTSGASNEIGLESQIRTGPNRTEMHNCCDRIQFSLIEERCIGHGDFLSLSLSLDGRQKTETVFAFGRLCLM